MMGVFRDSEKPLAITGLAAPGSDDSLFGTIIKIAFDKQNKPFPNFLDSKGRSNPYVGWVYVESLFF
jgi:hypothetical protein